jgi:hypothetical protein
MERASKGKGEVCRIIGVKRVPRGRFEAGKAGLRVFQPCRLTFTGQGWSKTLTLRRERAGHFVQHSGSTRTRVAQFFFYLKFSTALIQCYDISALNLIIVTLYIEPQNYGHCMTLSQVT